MRQLFVMAVLACVFMLAGCGSATGNKEASGDQTITADTTDTGTSPDESGMKEEAAAVPSTNETEKAAEGKEKEAEAAKETEAEKVTAEAAKETTEQAKTEKKTEPKTPVKQKKEVQKATEANKETNEAVVGSIMNKTETKAPAAKAADKADIEKAVTEIRELVKDLKQKAEAGSADEVKTISGQILKAWDSLKADVKAADAEMHAFIDEKMTALSEQSVAAEIDLEAILQTDYQLYQGFRQLAEKLGIE